MRTSGAIIVARLAILLVAAALPTASGQSFRVAGDNSVGELGLADTTSRNSFTTVSGGLAGKGIITIAGGDRFSVALADDGKVWTTGYDFMGQLGLGDEDDRDIFIQASGDIAAKSITAISGGYAHTLALASDGTVWGAGDNGGGALGLGEATEATNSFVQIGGGLSGKVVAKIACGNWHTLALDNDGKVWATGTNLYGELGLGDNTDRYVFTEVGGGLSGKTIIAIAAGEYHSLALAADGTLWVAGYNNFGQLGLGDNTTDRTSFTQAGGSLIGKTVTAISAGHLHSLARDSNGKVWATGYNAYGQLGLDDTTDRRASRRWAAAWPGRRSLPSPPGGIIPSPALAMESCLQRGITPMGN